MEQPHWYAYSLIGVGSTLLMFSVRNFGTIQSNLGIVLMTLTNSRLENMASGLIVIRIATVGSTITGNLPSTMWNWGVIRVRTL
jgi:hypothetical protein